ncbi:SGNH/GDSL hydrolase family protein [Gemmatimonadota bacterium]
MSVPQLAVFYLVPGTLLLFFGAAAFTRPETRINLLLLAFSVGAALLFSEFLLSLRPPPEEWPGVIAARNSPDPRSRLEVVRDLRAAGTLANPEYSPWLLRDHAMSMGEEVVTAIAPSPSHSIVVSCNEGKGWLTYETDEYGFRSRPGHEGQGPTDVALIGDSFTFGECVDEDETLAGRLRSRWPATRNLGVSGSGPLHQLAVLREYGSVLQPRVVVWMYYEENDLSDLQDELASPLLSKYMEPGYRVGLPEKQEAVDSWLIGHLDSEFEKALARADSGAVEVRGGVSLRDILKLTQLRQVTGFPVHFPEPDPVGMLPEVLRVGRDLVEGWGGDIVLVYMPAYPSFQFLGSEFRAVRSAVLSAAETLGILSLDLHSSFLSAVRDPRELWVHPSGHLNPRGYSIAADAIGSSIAPLLAQGEGGSP